MKQAVLIFSKKNDSKSDLKKKEVVDWLESKKVLSVDITLEEGLVDLKKLPEISLGIIIGGDGTFLQFLRKFSLKKLSFPLMGINLGSVGFITEMEPSEALSRIEDFFSGKVEEEKKSLLQIEICEKDFCRVSGFAFNDMVISKDARSSILKMTIQIDPDYVETLRADGYIVCTPTGSTAYSMSAGGPLLHPGVSAFVLSPICAYSVSSSRSLVIPENKTICIVPHIIEGDYYVVLDGQVNYALTPKDTIRIRKADHELRLIRSTQRNWSQKLKLKLGY